MKLNQYLTAIAGDLKITVIRGNLGINENVQSHWAITRPRTMKSHAELVAELEEKRLENNNLKPDIEGLSILEPDALGGYNPYDNPGIGKELADDVDTVALRRRRLLRKGRL